MNAISLQTSIDDKAFSLQEKMLQNFHFQDQLDILIDKQKFSGEIKDTYAMDKGGNLAISFTAGNFSKSLTLPTKARTYVIDLDPFEGVNLKMKSVKTDYSIISNKDGKTRKFVSQYLAQPVNEFVKNNIHDINFFTKVFLYSKMNEFPIIKFHLLKYFLSVENSILKTLLSFQDQFYDQDLKACQEKLTEEKIEQLIVYYQSEDVINYYLQLIDQLHVTNTAKVPFVKNDWLLKDETIFYRFTSDHTMKFYFESKKTKVYAVEEMSNTRKLRFMGMLKDVDKQEKISLLYYHYRPKKGLPFTVKTLKTKVNLFDDVSHFCQSV